jgi:hypothetical protein
LQAKLTDFSAADTVQPAVHPANGPRLNDRSGLRTAHRQVIPMEKRDNPDDDRELDCRDPAARGGAFRVMLGAASCGVRQEIA